MRRKGVEGSVGGREGGRSEQASNSRALLVKPGGAGPTTLELRGAVLTVTALSGS